MPKKCSFLATQEVKGRGNSNQLLDKIDHLSKLSSVYFSDQSWSFSVPKKCSFLATQEVKGRGNSNQLLDKVDHLSKLSSVLSTLVIFYEHLYV